MSDSPAVSAARALAALRVAYPGEIPADVRPNNLGDIATEQLVDLVADLFHLAFANDVHPDDVAHRAANYWFGADEAADTDPGYATVTVVVPTTQGAALEEVTEHVGRELGASAMFVTAESGVSALALKAGAAPSDWDAAESTADQR